MNQKLAAINGISVEDHIGHTVAEVVPDLWPDIESMYRRVLDSGEVIVNVEMSGETAAEPGRVHHWAANFYPVYEGAEIVGIGVLVLDITEQKQGEEFRAVVVDNMAEGLYALDGDGPSRSLTVPPRPCSDGAKMSYGASQCTKPPTSNAPTER